MKVSDIMSDRVITVGQDEPVIAAARLFKRYNLGAVPVCDDAGHLRGILTDRDIVLRCTALGFNAKDIKIRDIMTRGIVTVSPESDIDTAANQMSKDQIRRLPVVESGRLIGMLSLCDMARHCDMEAASALADISANVSRKRSEK